MKNTNKLIAASMLMLVVAGCGNNPNDRALSGAGIGAGVGAVGSAITGGSPVTGAVVGGLVGGAAGGLTKQKDISRQTSLEIVIV